MSGSKSLQLKDLPNKANAKQDMPAVNFMDSHKGHNEFKMSGSKSLQLNQANKANAKQDLPAVNFIDSHKGHNEFKSCQKHMADLRKK